MRIIWIGGHNAVHVESSQTDRLPNERIGIYAHAVMNIIMFAMPLLLIIISTTNHGSMATNLVIKHMLNVAMLRRVVMVVVIALDLGYCSLSLVGILMAAQSLGAMELSGAEEAGENPSCDGWIVIMYAMSSRAVGAGSRVD